MPTQRQGGERGAAWVHHWVNGAVWRTQAEAPQGMEGRQGGTHVGQRPPSVAMCGCIPPPLHAPSIPPPLPSIPPQPLTSIPPQPLHASPCRPACTAKPPSVGRRCCQWACWRQQCCCGTLTRSPALGAQPSCAQPGHTMLRPCRCDSASLGGWWWWEGEGSGGERGERCRQAWRHVCKDKK